MSITQDWRFKNECFPFEDDDFYYITVESAYETPGDDKEGRLFEAKRDGVFKLLKFYGKDTNDPVAAVNLFDISNVEDYYVAYRPCIRMKVLVSVPKENFDAMQDDPTACELNIPAEGYLSAFIPIGEASMLIQMVTQGMRELVLDLYASDKFISNVNVIREINRLSAAGRAIQRYLELNNIPPVEIIDPECVQPGEVDRELEIGFSYDYKAVFALVEGDQHTIGYDCFLETSVLNHDTTINYLINLRDMLVDLNSKNEPDFNVFDFFTKYTIPLPVILQKETSNDGIEKYDENGNLWSFANLAKLISFDLDVNLCKTDEEKAKEDSVVTDPVLKANIARAVKQTKEFVGDNKLSTEGVQNLRERLQDASERSDDAGKLGALKILYEDVMAKVNIGCVLEETIQCILENLVTTFGQEVFDDPDLEEVFNIRNVSLGGLLNNCSFDRCDGSPDVNLQANFPIFQGINIPSNLPTLDFLADTIDTALVSLYNTLVSSLSSLILGILEGLCDLLFSLPDGIAQIGEGFKSWLSQTLGIDLSLLDDPEAWKSALLTSTGQGFIGVIGKAASSVQGAFLDLYTETGIAINWPNPETGQIEEKFISPEFVTTFFSELNNGVSDMETVLTPSETQSIFKGSARIEVLDLAYKCVTRNGSTIFTSREVFQDTMSGIGDVLQPQFLLQNLPEQPLIAPDYCDLVDDLSIRKEILKGKDSTLTSEEIDEIINKEKERKKKTLLQKVDELNSYQGGRFAPPFPSIFGNGGLIPEPPPVINDISNVVADGLLAASIINFTADSSYYSQLWGQLLGEDIEGEDVEEFGASPRGIYSSFDGGVSYNKGMTQTDIVYNFGYEESITENTVAEVEVDGNPNIDVLGGAETVIFQNFGKNFKRDDFRPELTSTFFNGVSTDTAENILDFLEDKDEENGFHQQLFFDADNPLISYAVLVYHEGGRFGGDRLTEAALIKNEFDPVDQPETKQIIYDYGKLFGTGDKSVLKDQLLNTSWEGALSAGNDFADELADSIVGIANNDWEKINLLNVGGVGGGAVVAGGGAYLMSTVILGKAAAFITPAIGILVSEAFVGSLALAAGPIGWAIAAAAIIVGVAFILTKDSRDIAQRIIITEPQDGFIYTYDIIVSDKRNNVTVVERKISETLISKTGTKSPAWPTDIVSLTKGSGATTGVTAVSDVSKTENPIGKGYVQQYNQEFFFDTTGVGFGLKIDDGGLSLIDYSYLNDTTVDFGVSYLTTTIPTTYPLAALTLANMVEDSLSEFFTESSDAQVIQDISDEIKSNFKKLNVSALEHIIHAVRDEPDKKYWGSGYEAGNFNNLTLNENTLNYSSLKSDFVSFNSMLLEATLQNKYCDTIDALRRSNASQALILMIRLYIVEQAAISIQVFNKFDLAFMDSNIFSSNILRLMKNDMSKYQLSFEAVDVNLYQQLLGAAKKYSEALAIINDEEPVEFNEEYQYLEDLVKKEIPAIKSSIVNSLSLGQNWRTWDGFVTERVFPVFDVPTRSDTTLKTEPPISSFGDEPEYEFEAKGENLKTFTQFDAYEDEDGNNWLSGAKNYYGSAVPTEILDKIASDLEAWTKLYDGPVFPQTYGGKEELEENFTETIGDIQYRYEYKFKIKTSVPPKYQTKWEIKIVVRGDFTDDYLQRMTDDAILDPFNKIGESGGGSGFAFETYVKYAPKGKTYTIDGLTNFLSLLRKDVADGVVNGNDKLLNTYDYIRFGYRMILVQDATVGEAQEPSTYGKLSKVQARSDKQKAFILTNQNRSVNGATRTYDYYSIPLVSAECEYVDTTPNQDITIQQFLDTIEEKYSSEIYSNIKSMLLETDEYKRIVTLILPLKDMISATSFYQYASLSDETVFKNAVNGVTLHNMTSRAKLSTLQTFYISIYGGRQITFEDPFTKNLLT